MWLHRRWRWHRAKRPSRFDYRWNVLGAAALALLIGLALLASALGERSGCSPNGGKYSWIVCNGPGVR